MTIPGMVIVAAVMYAVSSRYSSVLAFTPASAEEACDDSGCYCDDTCKDDQPDDR